MARQDLILSLGKVMIAAAWADHDLSDDEVNSLKDLLFHLPQLNAAQWAELDIYLHSPVGQDERKRLVGALQRQIRTEKDRQLALQALESIVTADGTGSAYEADSFEQIRRAIENADTGLIGLVGTLVGGAIQRREDAAGSFPNRETQLEDFVRNRVFYSVQRRLNQGEAEVELDLPEAELRTLSLAGGLMARVAHVDERVSDAELKAIIEALRSHWDLTQKQATFVASIAASELSEDLDLYRLSRQFYEATSRQQRLQFLEVLFQVAAADGQATHQEIEDIRSIARTIKLSHRDFINAKLTLPRKRRSS